jgi:hypothetical protein
MKSLFVSVKVCYVPKQPWVSESQIVAVPVECILSRTVRGDLHLDLATPVWPISGDGPAVPLSEDSKKAFRAALRAGLEAHLGCGLSPFYNGVVDWEGQRATNPRRRPWKEDFGKG